MSLISSIRFSFLRMSLVSSILFSFLRMSLVSSIQFSFLRMSLVSSLQFAFLRIRLARSSLPSCARAWMVNPIPLPCPGARVTGWLSQKLSLPLSVYKNKEAEASRSDITDRACERPRLVTISCRSRQSKTNIESVCIVGNTICANSRWITCTRSRKPG